MAELTKQQLEAANAELFPNNNTGYITADKLRTFNDDMIVSLVDEIQYNADSASFSARINVLDPSGSAQAITALEQSTASLNSYTSSQNVRNTLYSSSIASLQSWSSSLDAQYATDAQVSASVSALSSSVAVTDLAQSQSIAALQQFSSSLDTTFATDTQLSASASTLQDNINSLSSSVAVTTLGLSASIAALDSGYATDTQLSASASTLQNDINTRLLTSSFQTYTSSVSTQIAALGTQLNTKLNTSSFNSYTQSNDSIVNSLVAQTSSYAQASYVNNLSGAIAETDATQSQQIATRATTGSNTFNGNQSITGSVSLTGTLTALSASITYLQTIYETASVIYSSGSNQLGDELSDVQTLSGSVKVQGELLVNGVPVQTSSFDASGYLLTSSFNTYTQSNDIKVNALIAQTGSYAISSSVANTFDAFSSSVSLTYATETELSASASTLQNGINSKVENSTFNTYTSSQATINTGLQTGITIRLLTSSFNTYTSSNDGKVNSLINATGSYITSTQTQSMSVLSSSYAQTASFALNVTPTDVTPFLSKSVFDTYTGSAALGVSESINSATQSLSSSIAVTTNNLDLEVNGKLDSSSFNTYTQSNDSVVNALVAATASYVTEAETGSFITSAQTSSMSVLSSSFAVTASYALNVTPTDVSMFVSQSTFNAYTQSNNSVVSALVSATSSYAISSSVAAINAAQDGQINSLIAQTSSYVTESETGSFARVNVSNVFTQNQTISGNLDVTGKITALSASITYLETIYQTSSVVYSSGSNILGDEASDTQTLFGKVEIKTGPLVITGSTFVSGNITLAQGSDLVTHHIKAAAVNGVEIQNNSGNTAILVGAGGSLGTTFYGQINTTAISSSGNITGNLIGTASYANKALTASFAENVTPTDVSMFLSQSTFNSYTQSNDSKVNALISSTGSYTTTSSFNSYTQSNNSKVDTLIAATASYVTSAQTASMTVLSSSYSLTASFALNAGASIDTGSFAKTGSNTFVGNQIISGNLLVTGSNINLEVDPPALSVGVTNVKTVLDATASGVVSSTDIYRTGAGPTGDLSGIRLLTLSGSDTTGDTLLSRIQTAVNRHTSTGMTGSVVNTIITSQWATGSGGTRVTYGSTITANAQSASATITLAAGNGAANNNGGTASISAGLIRIGGNSSHTISVTGSFGPISVVGALTASVVSASTYIGIPTINTSSLATTGSNTFTNKQTIDLTALANSQDALRILGNGEAVSTDMFVNGGNYDTFNVFVSASNGVQLRDYSSDSDLVLPFISTDTNAGKLHFHRAISAPNNDPNGSALSIATGSVSINSTQGTGFFYSNLPMTSSGLRINGTALVNDLIISGVFSGNSSLQVKGNASVSGNLFVSGVADISSISSSNGLSITGSVRGTQTAGDITGGGTTASFDCSTGNFFTLVLSGGTNHLSASNIRPGQTISVRITTQTNNAVTCSSAIKQPSGSLYTPTNGAGTDILTFISYDSTLYMVSAKNFI